MEPVREPGGVLLEQIAGFDAQIDTLNRGLRAAAREDEEVARLMTVPGVGPITAMAFQAFAPPMESFQRGRDFAAWLGLVPRQHTTGGKPRLGKISKMGQRDLRCLLITGVNDDHRRRSSGLGQRTHRAAFGQIDTTQRGEAGMDGPAEVVRWWRLADGAGPDVAGFLLHRAPFSAARRRRRRFTPRPGS